MSIAKVTALTTAVGFALLAGAGTVEAEDRQVKITGIGTMSGIVRTFGLNSKAALEAAADQINKAGGVKLGDGTKGKIVVEFLDDRCNAEEGISALRRVVSSDALVAVGPTCSNVAEPLFGTLQKKVGDATDTGLQFPVFTDVAIKIGLAKISEWAFRNVPNETEMYTTLFKWVKAVKPQLKTVYGGVEDNFAHSRASWFAVMKEAAAKEGFEVKGESKWLLEDTNFSNQARETKKAEADVVAIAAHPFSTCGMLKEMARQGLKPKLLIGLTSSSSLETMQGCAHEAENIIIPTSFAPINDRARAAATAVAKFNGNLDLHSAAAWENVFILKKIIEDQKVMARPDTLKEDRAKIREGLAKLTESDGLLGKSKRTADREALKPYLFVQAKAGKWQVLHTPDQHSPAVN